MQTDAQKKTLIWSLEELSSKYEQERLWLNIHGNNFKEVSLPQEALCGVFDDSGLSNFIREDTLQENFSKNICDKIMKLHHETRLEVFPDHLEFRELIDDPQMEKLEF